MQKISCYCSGTKCAIRNDCARYRHPDAPGVTDSDFSGSIRGYRCPAFLSAQSLLHGYKLAPADWSQQGVQG